MARQTNFIEARRVLHFSRQHDWGINAVLRGDERRGYFIDDLHEVIARVGEAVTVDTVSLPADMQTVRDWAGY